MIRNLLGQRWAFANAFGVAVSPIAGDDFSAEVGCQPSSNSIALSIRQQIDDPIGLKIHQNSAVSLSLASNPIVDARYTRRTMLGLTIGANDP